MTTPIIDFVKNYISSDSHRLHMPGHKGKGLLGFEEYDITEIDGADVLYNAKGIIKQSMENAAQIFGTAKTLYSAEGSSLSIRAMLYLTLLYANARKCHPVIFAARNAHKVFITQAGLLDIDVRWIQGSSGSINECIITPRDLEWMIRTCEPKPVAVYITSPDYLGNIADIKGIADVCRRNTVLLLVDNAHGAYLKFLPKDIHPITLGAHMCCDSAHKTLPALTGAGYLHISERAPELLKDNAEKAMSIYASTSPSYLILQSLDALNRYLTEGYTQSLRDYCRKTGELRDILCNMGIAKKDTEPLKITLTPKEYGYKGNKLAAYLREKKLICEFYDPDYVVMMLTPENGDEVLRDIYLALSGLPRKRRIKDVPPPVPGSLPKISAKCVMLSPTRTVDVKDSEGKVFAGVNAACPPAIPIAVCGEIIDKDVIALLEYYGIKECEVMKD